MLLVGRQEGHSVWHGYLSGAMCRLAYGAAVATATQCPFSKIHIGFYLSGTDSPGWSLDKGPLSVCVCVCVCVRACVCACYLYFNHVS